jgi:hypothetical protein
MQAAKGNVIFGTFISSDLPYTHIYAHNYKYNSMNTHIQAPNT